MFFTILLLFLFILLILLWRRISWKRRSWSKNCICKRTKRQGSIDRKARSSRNCSARSSPNHGFNTVDSNPLPNPNSSHSTMWGTIANFKENLNKIALDVHYAHDDDDDDDDNDQHHVVSPAVSDRRNSHTFAHSNSFPSSPPPNGMSDHPYASEVRSLQILCLFVCFLDTIFESRVEHCNIS